MKKIVVGILPQIKLNTDDNPYNDKYELQQSYTFHELTLIFGAKLDVFVGMEYIKKRVELSEKSCV